MYLYTYIYICKYMTLEFNVNICFYEIISTNITDPHICIYVQLCIYTYIYIFKSIYIHVYCIHMHL
jgi:hypothetical protein